RRHTRCSRDWSSDVCSSDLILLITHDLGVVANMAEEVVVMYRGRVMEHGTVEDIFRDPRHPYLKALLHAVPRFDMAPGERLVPRSEERRVGKEGSAGWASG